MTESGAKKKTHLVNDDDEADTTVETVEGSGNQSGDGGGGSGETILGEMGDDDMRTEDVEEDDEEDEEAEDDGGEDEEEEEVEEDRPTLDEGYYEVEAIRRKRVSKGQAQYLIKWHGWPESANTWEPFENLESISDAVDAFEERLRLGKGGRKRKRKFGGSNSHLKKKKKQQGLTSTSHDASERTNSSTSLNNFVGPIRGPLDLTGPSLLNRDEETANQVEATNGSVGEVGQASLSGEEKEYDPTLNELREEVINSNGAGCSSQGRGGRRGIGSEDDNERSNEVDKSSRVIGAKRRKFGTVQRFIQDETASNNQTTSTDQNGTPDLSTLDAGNNLSQKNREDLEIVRIIKPVGYSTIITNNIQDSLVTFSALRSDGEQVTVDNKFLRARNHHLLLDFYEQHIKFAPPES